MAATPDVPRLSKDQPIDLVAASSDFDYKKNALLFKQVKITQGPLKVEADEASATGLNFEDSDWTLKGNVKITVPDGMLTSADAKVTFRKNQIARAEIRGAPAEFEQLIKETGKLAKGHANSIIYDVQADTVRLAGDAWLTDGDNVIRGETLIYDIAGQRVAARNRVLASAFRDHPERFPAGQPTAVAVPIEVWINRGRSAAMSP